MAPFGFVTRGIDKNCPKISDQYHSEEDKRQPFTSWSRFKDKSAAVTFTEDQLRNTFRRYDTNRDGRLSKKELKEAFTAIGSRLPALRATFALLHADNNGDGYISEDELEKLVKYTHNHGYKIK